MTDKEFMGKKVVSLSDGEKLGKVKDLIFTGLKLTDLVVKGERGEGLLPFKNLSANGPDAIMVETYALIDWNVGPALTPESRTAHELEKLKVVDDKGKMIGHMHDYTMDTNGVIEEISVRTEGVFGIGAIETIVPSKRVRAIGSDLITVERTASH